MFCLPCAFFVVAAVVVDHPFYLRIQRSFQKVKQKVARKGAHIRNKWDFIPIFLGYSENYISTFICAKSKYGLFGMLWFLGGFIYRWGYRASLHLSPCVCSSGWGSLTEEGEGGRGSRKGDWYLVLLQMFHRHYFTLPTFVSRMTTITITPVLHLRKMGAQRSSNKWKASFVQSQISVLFPALS